MLRLERITKEYPLDSNEKVLALKGISLQFRNSEFVSILGHSGCGKTTLLNIIGGLDRYTQGELFINGISTKKYKDKDWDTYRNHRVGFVFQTYNLIMHLSVIENVELALTLVGLDRKTRHERAKQALAAVGLAGHERKKPNQLSGGQMQRVAIARALINNPDILLADEPTGALDSETSVQIMELLKSLSQNRLVIMVTHNPDLAYQYSTRIVRLTDGMVTDDSDPYQPTEQEVAEALAAEQQAAQEAAAAQDADAPARKKKKGNKKKADNKDRHTSMSYKSALSLSGKNMWMKRTRTGLTSVAGSIGIIGIAIVLALSSGFATYVSSTAENALSQYPLTITGSDMSMSSIVSVFMNAMMSTGEYESFPDSTEIGLNPILSKLLGSLDDIFHSNDIKTLKVYLDDRFDEEWGTVKYDYNLTMHIYTNFAAEEGDDLQYYKINPYAARVMDQFSAVIGTDDSAGTNFGNMLEGVDLSGLLGNLNAYSTMFNVWDELSTNSSLLRQQYELIGGHWPRSKEEIVLVVDQYNHIDDYVLFAMGLSNPNDAGPVLLGEITGDNPLSNWTFTAQDLIDTVHYQLLLESSYYSFDAETGEWQFVPYLVLANDSTQAVRDLVEPQHEDGTVNENCQATTLRLSGIIRLREGVGAGSINGFLAYTHDLVTWMMEEARASEVVRAQRAIRQVYRGRGKQEGVGNDANRIDKVEYYTSGPAIEDPLEGRVLLGSATYYYADEGADKASYHDEPLWQFAEGQEDEVRFLVQAGTGIAITRDYIKTRAGTYDYATLAYPNNYTMKYYKLAGSSNDTAYYGITTGGESALLGEVPYATYCDWLHDLGYAELDSPSSISIFASSFANKDKILSLLDHFGADKDLDGDGIADGVDLDGDGIADGSELQYSDTVGTLMSGVTLIIKAITYVLIAFSSISLIVSSIMIAIITYTSVMERTKEIGILRSLGARKKDITRVFNSETFIIGLISGLIAVLFTWMMSFPVNAILKSYTGIARLVVIAWWHPLLLVGLSITLTFIAGFIPSRMAAAKDPVLALRTE